MRRLDNKHIQRPFGDQLCAKEGRVNEPNADDLNIRAKNLLWFESYLDDAGQLYPEKIDTLKRLIRTKDVLRWRNIGAKTYRHLCDVFQVTPDEQIKPHSLSHDERRVVIAMRRKDKKTALKVIEKICGSLAADVNRGGPTQKKAATSGTQNPTTPPNQNTNAEMPQLPEHSQFLTDGQEEKAAVCL